MRAARIHEHGGPEVFQVDEVPEPEPQAGEVVIRQRFTSINHRDVWLRKGLPDETFQIDLPAILGVDCSGEVVALGAGVTGLSIGDRIVANPFVACGTCHACIRQRQHHCAQINIANGSYAQYAVVPEERAIRISPNVTAEAAAAFPNSYITAWEMLVNKARLTPEDTVFIWAGTSGLGSAGLQIAKLTGARVITTAGQPHKLAALREHGADLVLDHYEDDVVAQVMEYTGGVGASVVFEHTGASTWGRSLDLASSGARIVNVGLTTGQNLETDAVNMIMKQLTIMGSCLGTMAAARAAVAHLNSGHLSPLIGETVPLTKIVDAHRMIDEGRVTGKILIDLDA